MYFVGSAHITVQKINYEVKTGWQRCIYCKVTHAKQEETSASTINISLQTVEPSIQYCELNCLTNDALRS